MVAIELAHYHMGIAALSKTRRANEGQVSDDGSGYCFIWSDRTSEERREAGVGFVIRSRPLHKVGILSKRHNDSILAMQRLLTTIRKVTLSDYASTVAYILRKSSTRSMSN